MAESPLRARLGAEFLGTFGLVFGGCGNAFGHVSGGHVSPAVSIGLAVAKRFSWRYLPAYVITQIVAASLAGAVLFVIATSKKGATAATVRATGFATNGYGAHSPGGYGARDGTAGRGGAHRRLRLRHPRRHRRPGAQGFGPIAIGLALTLIHLISIPIDNTSVTPARSLGVAWFAGGAAWPRFGCSSWRPSSVR